MSGYHEEPNLTNVAHLGYSQNSTKSAKRRHIKKIRKDEIQGNTGREEKETNTIIGIEIKKIKSTSDGWV